jgi:hypothetical protein
MNFRSKWDFFNSFLILFLCNDTKSLGKKQKQKRNRKQKKDKPPKRNLHQKYLNAHWDK